MQGPRSELEKIYIASRHKFGTFKWLDLEPFISGNVL